MLCFKTKTIIGVPTKEHKGSKSQWWYSLNLLVNDTYTFDCLVGVAVYVFERTLNHVAK